MNPCQQSSIPNLQYLISNNLELVESQCTGDWVNNDALGCMDETSCTYDNLCLAGTCKGTAYPPILGECYIEAYCHGQLQYRSFDFYQNDSVVCSPADPFNSCIQPSYCTNWTAQCPINVILTAVVNFTSASYGHSSMFDIATQQSLMITVNDVTVSCGWLNYTYILLDVTHDVDYPSYGSENIAGTCPSFNTAASNLIAMSSGLWQTTSSFDFHSLVNRSTLQQGSMILGMVQIMNSQNGDSYYCTPSLIFDTTAPSNGNVSLLGAIPNNDNSIYYWNNCNKVAVEWRSFDDPHSSIISYTIQVDIDLNDNGTFTEWTRITLMDTSIYQFSLDLAFNGTFSTVGIINGHNMKVYVIATNGVGLTTKVSASLIPFMIDCTPAVINTAVSSMMDNSVVGGLPHYDHVRYLYNPTLSLLFNVTFDAMHLYGDDESSVVMLLGELQISMIGSSRWQRAVATSGSIDDIILDRYALYQVCAQLFYLHASLLLVTSFTLKRGSLNHR
jgi:hypothetical protein